MANLSTQFAQTSRSFRVIIAPEIIEELSNGKRTQLQSGDQAAWRI
jgi:hypothetical protein